MPGTVRDRIVDTIRDRGPIRFDEFMELALYGDGGYYDRPPVGPAGDFVTSPHVHAWFAYGIALAFGELHDALGSPVPARIVELGAGDGTLAAQLLDILREGGALEYVAVERGRDARAKLARPGVRVHASIDELDSVERAVVVANELLDNLPFRRLRRAAGAAAGGVVEIHVGLQDGRLVEVELPTNVHEPAADVAAGSELVVPTGALELIDALASRMREAYALLIDYSAERGRDVHGYRAHRVVEDVLEHPGELDITAGVDLDAVEERARAAGLSVLGRVTQRDALLALGYERWVRTNRDPATRSAEAGARAWAARTRASLLVAPDGLGAHRWLLLSTRGLPSPAWLDDALARRSTG